MNKNVTAILLCAGSSSRYKTGTNKNFEKINNRTVLSYSLREFALNKYISDIIIATRESEKSIVENIVKEEKIEKSVKIVFGGASRKESVFNCLKKTCSDYVIIHDGARPLIKQEYINQCIESMKEFDAVTMGVKSKDTIKIADENGIVKNTTNRSNTYIIQTPQCFKREILLMVHEKAKDDSATDDCMLFEENGYRVKIINSDYTNIKITTFEDLDIVKLFWKMNDNKFE